MSDDRKTEPPLGLDMGFDEALERFARVKPRELKPGKKPGKGKRSKVPMPDAAQEKPRRMDGPD